MGRKGAESKHLEHPDVIPAADPGWTAIIDGKWKLHRKPGAKKEAPTQLYDIHTDPGETENVACNGYHLLVSPHLQHAPVLGDPVLRLAGTHQTVRVDALQADEDSPHPCGTGLVNEVGDLVTERVDLNHQIELDSLSSTQLDQAVEAFTEVGLELGVIT